MRQTSIVLALLASVAACSTASNSSIDAPVASTIDAAVVNHIDATAPNNVDAHVASNIDAAQSNTIDAAPLNAIDAASGTPDATPATPESIKTLRMALPSSGTPVALTNVIVTASVESKKDGSIWVQDQGGGTYSGIHIFCDYGGTHPNCSMTEAQFEALAIGDVVSLTGTFSLYTPTTPTGAPSEIEIDSPTITATGATMTPMSPA